MREQLQALIDEIDADDVAFFDFAETVADRLRAILASQPAVSVKPGWVCKGQTGLKLCHVHPNWYENAGAWGTDYAYQENHADDVVTDPWPDHPNGGPECIMEVK